jgi:hypothetical protein
MIRVSISSLGSVLACCALGTVLVVWLWSGLRDTWIQNQFERRKRKCRLCFFEFLSSAPPDETVRHREGSGPGCPRCGAPSVPSASAL